jgi:hypothetical protein
MMTHPDDALLTRWFDGTISDEDPSLADHLASCAVCQQRLAEPADEAAAWHAALTLTPVELGILRDADLPGRLVAAVERDRQVGLWHLLALVGVTLAVALTWMLTAPVVEPALTWSDRLISVTSLVLAVTVPALSLAITALAQAPLASIAALTAQALPAAAVLLLVGLWLYQSRPLAPMPAAH